MSRSDCVAALLLELVPHVAVAGHEVLRHELLLRVPEELEVVLAPADRLRAILVHREGGDHGEVRVDGVSEGHALVAADDVVVDLRPVARLVRVEERERERPDPVPGRDP